MGLEHDAPPHSHMEVPFTYELEAGCVGPSADGAQTNDPDFGAQGFDEDAWFEAQAERLRQRNQQQSMEVIAPPFQCDALCAPLVCFLFLHFFLLLLLLVVIAVPGLGESKAMRTRQRICAMQNAPLVRSLFLARHIGNIPPAAALHRTGPQL